MNAREKDLLKFVGKAVTWKGIIVNSDGASYGTIVSTCVGYSLDRGHLIVDAAPTGRVESSHLPDPIYDVIIFPCDRYVFVNPNNAELV